MSQEQKKEQGSVGIWLRAVRPFAYTATIIPVVVGAILGAYYTSRVDWVLLAPALVAALLLHTGTNLISDYFDYVNDVDKDYTFGSSGVLLEGLLKPSQILYGSFFAFGLACLIGLVLVAIRGVPLLVIGVIGLLGGCLYAGRPVGYKHIALGDVCVFILMGPLMVAGSYLTLTGVFDVRVLWVSFSIGCLVASILHANNLRDRAHDRQAGVKTLANTLSYVMAKRVYYVLVLGAYVSIFICMVIGILPQWSGIIFFSFPVAIANMRKVMGSREGDPGVIGLIDQDSAKLHFLFGVLLILSIGLGVVLP